MNLITAFFAFCIFYLFVVREFDGLHLLRPVLVVVEVVLDGEGLEQLHRGLRADLGDSVEEEDVFGGFSCVVQLVGVQLKRNLVFVRSRVYAFEI